MTITPYTRQANFTDHSANDPDEPHDGTDLDAEFNAIQTTLQSLISRVESISRADGRLANGIVTSDSLGSGLTVGVNPAEDWVTATEYTVSTDLVWFEGKLYQCSETHTSDTFSTDLASGYWTEIFDLIAEITAISGIFGSYVETVSGTVNLEESDNGSIKIVDTSAGVATINVPDSTALTDPDFFRLRIVATSANYAVTIGRQNAADTIAGEGAGNKTLATRALLHADIFCAGSGEDYYVIPYNEPNALSVDTAQLAADSVTEAKIADENVTAAKLADASVTPRTVDPAQAADVNSTTGTVTLDMTTTRYQKITATGAFTFDVTPPDDGAGNNVPGTAIVECVNWGSLNSGAGPTLSGIDHTPDGAALSFTVSGTDLLSLSADDDGNITGFIAARNKS